MVRRSKRLVGAVEHAVTEDELLSLLNAAVEGDPSAAAALVEQVGGSMLTVIRRVLGSDHNDIHDVAQEATIAFLRALSTFRKECRVVHFANRIALATALDLRRRLRSRGRWWDFGERNLETIADDGGSSPLTNIVRSRRRALVRQLIGELPTVIGETVAAYFLLDQTVEEIAAMFAVSQNTVRSRLRLGKKALREKVQRNRHLTETLDLGEEKAAPE